MCVHFKLYMYKDRTSHHTNLHIQTHTHLCKYCVKIEIWEMDILDGLARCIDGYLPYK